MKRLIPKPIKTRLREFINNKLDGYATKSYSQEGEDMILRKLLEFEATGFYIDVGAHHPMRFSNTYYFYKKGWAGLNIDARPGIKQLFDSARPRDINIESGVSPEKCKLTYFMFNEPALNTFDSKLANERVSNIFYITDKTEVDCLSLSELLDIYLPKNRSITFMSIDIEGYDLPVLKSNNWDKYRPLFIVVESYDSFIVDVIEGEIYKYLLCLGYKLFSKSYLSLIFKDTSGYPRA